MTKKYQWGRRTLLKSSSAAILTIGGTGIVSASNDTITTAKGPFDTSFDPTNEGELKRVAVRFDTLPDTDKDRLWEQFDRKQRGGIFYALAPRTTEKREKSTPGRGGD